MADIAAQACGRIILRGGDNAPMPKKRAAPKRTEIFDADGMAPLRRALLAVCEDLVQRGTVNSLTDWAGKAKVSDRSIGNFLAGRTRSLNVETYAALADVAGLPISALLGEDVPRSEKERLVLMGYRAAPPLAQRSFEAQARRELGETDAG